MQASFMHTIFGVHQQGYFSVTFDACNRVDGYAAHLFTHNFS